MTALVRCAWLLDLLYRNYSQPESWKVRGRRKMPWEGIESTRPHAVSGFMSAWHSWAVRLAHAPGGVQRNGTSLLAILTFLLVAF